MSTTYILAIGGTGSRVLRSLSMLLASGCAGTSTVSEIVPIIFDYDLTNGDMTKKTVPVLKNYAKIHNKVYKATDKKEGMFFCTPMIPIRNKTVNNGINVNSLRFNPNPDCEYSAWINQENVPTTFSDFLGYEQMTGDLYPTHLLLDALYNNSSVNDPTTEINMDFTIGFKGCPNIGCLVAEHFTETPEYKHFKRVFNQNAGDRIVIIGSVFGGTGASGIPIILDSLRRDIGNQAKISVLAMAPYFSINTQNGGVIDSKTFIAKFRAAMTAYDLDGNVNSKATRIYYVGDNDMAVPFNYCDGGTNQQNPAVFAELVGAMCVMHFIGSPEKDFPQSTPALAYEMGMQGNSPISNVNNPIVEGTNMILGWDNFFINTIGDFLKPMRRLAIFAKFCNEYINDKIPNNENWYHTDTGIKHEPDLIQAFKDFYTLYKTWLDELRSDHRPLKIVSLSLDEGDYKKLMDGFLLEQSGFFGIGSWSVTNKSIANAFSRSFNDELSGKTQEENKKRIPYIFMSSANVAVNRIDDEIDEKKQIDK